MNTPLIVANWKTGVSVSSARAFARALSTQLTVWERRHLVVCPSAPTLGVVHNAAPHVTLGAQDCSAFEEGAHTGDVVARDLRAVGCRFVVVGHSERRTSYAETNAIITEKVKRCVAANLTPIICVGETKQERDRGETDMIIEAQLQSIKGEAPHRVIVAYEPLWAIGAKEPASESVINEIHQHIQSVLRRWRMSGVTILYGGAVDAQHIASICALPNVGGVLVGRASWNASSLRGLLRALQR